MKYKLVIIALLAVSVLVGACQEFGIGDPFASPIATPERVRYRIEQVCKTFTDCSFEIAEY